MIRGLDKAAVAFLALSCLLLSTLHAGQQTQAGPREITLTGTSCSQCRIISESTAYLGFDEDSAMLLGTIAPARDSRGRIFVASSGPDRVVYEFDSRGVLRRTFGRSGSGPGEFNGPVVQLRAGPGDTLYYFQRNIAHLFNPELQFVRSIPVPPPSTTRSQSIVLAGGAVARAVTPHRIAHAPPNAVVGATVPTVLLQGSDTACFACGSRNIARSNRNDAIWSMPANTYSVEEHDLTGRRLTRIERRASWFPTWMPFGTPTTPQQALAAVTRALVLGIHQDAEGLLWISVLAPDLDVPIPAGFDITRVEGQAQRDFFVRHFASYVDVIDPEKGVLLASRKFNELFFPMEGGYAAVTRKDRYGGDAFVVMRMRLAR